MPNTRAAAKRMRSDAVKRERNQAALSELKTMDQKLRRLASDPKAAKEFSKALVSKYDRAASRGIVPGRRAARKKSRIAAFLTRLSPQ